MQTVASGTVEVEASIGEISRNTAYGTQTAADAVDAARSANAVMRALSGSSDQIGNVVRVIDTIAGQTNLLALNATIEAAGAGDAGDPATPSSGPLPASTGLGRTPPGRREQRTTSGIVTQPLVRPARGGARVSYGGT